MTVDFEREMAELADKHREAMRGMTVGKAADYVKRVLDSAILAFGVYSDVASPSGVRLHIIKGTRELQVVIASGNPDRFLIEAIPCVDLKQAIAVSKMWSDRQAKCRRS
jgi:hypothetical protein